MYKDFNNQAQEPGVKSRPATVYAEGAIPPLSMRPRSGPLLQVPSTMDVHTSFYDTSLAHESHFSTGERSSGLFDRDTKTFRPLIPNDSQWELDDRAPLGAEYTDMEREQMTRAYRRFYWRNKFLGKIDSWLRGYNPLGGWLGPQIAVILTVIVLALYVGAANNSIGVGLFFVIPRVPGALLLLTRRRVYCDQQPYHAYEWQQDGHGPHRLPYWISVRAVVLQQNERHFARAPGQSRLDTRTHPLLGDYGQSARYQCHRGQRRSVQAVGPGP